ncbi:ATP synthase subunit C [Thermochromatium tepidum]|uniref:ATPase n=1 Tax=Thermochromatium tepidum ATCC 43061 TaxID=316276 RepID=A0A6I6E766_THETI|nr:ATP synthase subunit C [Thermochromatium tepidum]QGU32493.1 ATPase [Thermochromatium tepidum ATCC 43061]
MLWLVALMSFAILGLIVAGFLLDQRPQAVSVIRSWFRPLLGSQLVVFVGAQIALLVLGVSDALAVPETGAAAGLKEMSIGMGLAMIGVGIPTGLSTIGAGIAVGPIGAASLAAITEKPENLGRTLIYLGLAEGIAIYGLVISILLLNKL